MKRKNKAVFTLDMIGRKQFWTFNVRFKRKHCRTELGAKKDFLALADVIAAEARRIKKEMSK